MKEWKRNSETPKNEKNVTIHCEDNTLNTDYMSLVVVTVLITSRSKCTGSNFGLGSEQRVESESISRDRGAMP